jgi:hypothetical protein
MNISCGESLTTPLFLNLSDPKHAHLVGSAFDPTRTQEVAVFRLDVPAFPGTTTSLVIDTCGSGTTVGTLLSVHDECPDPWRAAREANYLAVNAVADAVSGASAVNDDDATCGAGALTTSGSPPSRASRVRVTVGGATTSVFILVQRDASTDVVGWPTVARAITITAKCSVTTPEPTPTPTLLPTPVPSFDFVTRLSLNATLRVEFATTADFDQPGAREAFAAAMAQAVGFVESDGVVLHAAVDVSGRPCEEVLPSSAPTPAPSPLPSPAPTSPPQPQPTPAPTSSPLPSSEPTPVPTPEPTVSLLPSPVPTVGPTRSPTPQPSGQPTTVKEKAEHK